MSAPGFYSDMAADSDPEAMALRAASAAGFEAWKITSRDEWLARRKRHITASVAPALLGIHEFVTPFALWADKRHSELLVETDTVRISENEITMPPMVRGTALEPVALDLLAQLRPAWSIAPGRHYYSDSDTRFGATPDAYAIDPSRNGFGIIQIKSIGEWASGKWRDADTGEDQPPLWIAVQAIVEATLTGASWAVVAALRTGGSLSLRMIDIPLHARTMVNLRERAADFWRRVDENDPFDPDFARDGALLARMHESADDSDVDLSSDQRVAEIVNLRALLKARESDGRAAEKERRALDAELIHRLGNASRGRMRDGTVIHVSMRRRAEHVVKAGQWLTVSVKQDKRV